jgi:C-methyltransferase C-terminal domain/Putative zinc binding domain/Methyltransferase domain
MTRAPSLPPTSLRTRTTCRICGSSDLTPVLDLGHQNIAGAFNRPGEEEPHVQRAIPLELVWCDMTKDQDACGLLQTRHSVPPALLYQSYWYRSGINRTMTEHLHELARKAEETVGLSPGDLVVDIGCNDGTLFDGYKTDGLRYLGFDPSDVTRYAIEKGYEVERALYDHDRFARRYPDQKAKVLTSIAMFYDLEEPAAFVADAAQTLAEGGVWIIELHYLPLMLERNQFDAIVHEHLEYYTLAVLERLLGDAGLQVIWGDVNDLNGGSIQLFIAQAGRRHISEEAEERLQRLRIKEFEMALDSPEPYAEFATRVARVRDDLSRLCRSLVEDGKTIHVYGASTKGNTILQYAGLDRELIPYAADRNPDKWGSETIRTRIPIISEEESRAMHPDYYLVLPWHFLDEFIEREREFFAGGGRFIVPLPEVSVIDGSRTGIEAPPSGDRAVQTPKA